MFLAGWHGGVASSPHSSRRPRLDPELRLLKMNELFLLPELILSLLQNAIDPDSEEQKGGGEGGAAAYYYYLFYLFNYYYYAVKMHYFF